jgi:hypothetical protein
MSETDGALDEMERWLVGLSSDEAIEGAVSLEQGVAALLALVGLQAGERLRITAPGPLDDAYVVALEGACGALGATFAAEPYVDALVSFESALGAGTGAEDAALLDQAASVLKAGGRYVIELPNREWVAQNDVQNRVFSDADGRMYIECCTLDFVTSRHSTTISEIGTDGSRREVASSSRRLYTLTELIALLEAASLRFETVYGGFEGEIYGPDMPRMVVLARRNV